MQGLTIPNRYKFDALVTTYEMASAGASLLREVQWKAGVFDEAHRLKNKVDTYLFSALEIVLNIRKLEYLILTPIYIYLSNPK